MLHLSTPDDAGSPKKKAQTAVPPKVPTAGPNPLVHAASTSDNERQQEHALRPTSLQEYVGQSTLKQSLNVSIEAARHRGDPLEHCLLYGPPGMGKTSLAMVVANAMEAPFQLTSAPALERPRDIVGLLMALEPGTLLFIDEIHRLNRVTEELLYTAMEDFCLDHTVGKGVSARPLRVPLPKFTLMGATTKAGSLSAPLRDRFGHLYRLQAYTLEELTQLLKQSAERLGLSFEPDAAELLASRCRGTPRIANRLLRRVRDVAQVQAGNETIKALSPAIIEEALSLFDIDAKGLDPLDRAFLQVMAEQFGGGPVGLEALAATLGEDVRTLEDMVEPYLLQAGLVQRTPRGRVLSQQAVSQLNLLPG